MRWSLPKPLYYYTTGITVVGSVYLLKDYLGGVVYQTNEHMKDKVVIVTGANSGIGREVALDLAKHEAKVIMACRDMDKCEIERVQMVMETRNKYIYCRKCDLASQTSIRNFVNEFKKEHKKLHILINNAGVMSCPKTYTEEGIEMQLGVNHMGHFLLTNLLLDVLKDSAPARIINVSSAAHKRGKINLKDLNSQEDYEPSAAYAQSKLANILFTRELANKLKGTDVTVNAVHPGIVRTGITRHMGLAQYFLGRILINTITWIFIKPPTRGAQPILFLALDPSVKDVTGAYFEKNKTHDLTINAKNDDIARWLWEVSAKWTGLNVV